jgi:cadmium resistance protein CadD (predicted permease)
MWALLTGIPGLIAGLFGSINHITDAISNEKIALINAKTQEEQIAVTERVKTLEAKRDLMIAEAGASRLNIWVRSFIALGPASFLLKVFLYDKVIGAFLGCSGKTAPGTCGTFVTDPLDPNLWQVISIVLGFYFLYEGAVGITRIIKR